MSSCFFSTSPLSGWKNYPLFIFFLQDKFRVLYIFGKLLIDIEVKISTITLSIDFRGSWCRYRHHNILNIVYNVYIFFFYLFCFKSTFTDFCWYIVKLNLYFINQEAWNGLSNISWNIFALQLKGNGLLANTGQGTLS